ncbi:MAG TPA: bacteriohemerythrin [Sediminispirochaeta sp.]|nr:bacteriohemerythrin [Sediminispirochaeta sp.]
MPLLKWNKELSVEINSIDEQHKKLIQMLNNLFTALKNDEEANYLRQMLKGLAEYTVEHFQYEEDLMQEHGYDGYAEHKAEHDRFVSKVSEFRKKFDSDDEDLAIEMLDFISDWIQGHIMGTDKKYSPFLLGKGVG